MINEKSVPKHIAIIMDGNGRWATKRGLPRTAGHAAGAETFRRVAEYCKKIGVKHLTVYAFSTENWSRSKVEVAALMALFKKYLEEAAEKLAENNIKICVIGDPSGLDLSLQKLIKKVEAMNVDSDFVCNLAVNYGGRAEIVNAVNTLVKEGKAVTQESLAGSLYTSGQPEPDLIIRTGGEKRLSNFLMWQSAYSELYFCDTLWPDFSDRDIDIALEEFSRRERRFGKA